MTPTKRQALLTHLYHARVALEGAFNVVLYEAGSGDTVYMDVSTAMKLVAKHEEWLRAAAHEEVWSAPTKTP